MATRTSSSPAAPSASPTSWPRTALAGLIVPDLPLEEARTLRAACDAAGVALVRSWPRRRPTSAWRASAPRARGFVYTVSVTGTTGERPRRPTTSPSSLARVKAHTDVPVALGFGISTPEQAARAADAGAEGVIVGSRLVARRGRGRRSRWRRSARSWRARRRARGRFRADGLVLTTTFGLVIWIVLWALGAKAFDSFLITVVIVLVGATRAMLDAYLPGNAAPEEPARSDARRTIQRRLNAIRRPRRCVASEPTRMLPPLIGIASLRRDLASTFTGSFELPGERPCVCRCRVRQRSAAAAVRPAVAAAAHP